jgi:translin
VELSELAGSLRERFDAKTSARERSLASSREAVRACGNAIRALHRYEIESASALLSDAQSHLDAAREVLAGHDDMMYAGFVHDAEKELAEARITFALVTDAAFPSPDELGLSPAAFLKGMAEAIGELRRHILDLMRRGDLQRCEELLGAMDDMYYLLVSMDYPDGITFGLRRLTDIARSIIERTRGDFTTSSIQRSLRDVLEDHAAQIRREVPPPPPG